MSRRSVLVVVLVGTLLAASHVYCQEVAPGRWWRDPSIVRDLALTSREQRALDDLYERNRDSLITMKADLERERIRLAELMRREPLDEASISAQMRRVEEKQQRLTQERMKYLIEVRKILGRQRFTILESLAPPPSDAVPDSPERSGRGRRGPTRGPKR